jgi:uncharacterized membrane protein
VRSNNLKNGYKMDVLKTKIAVVLIVFVTVISACYNDNVEDLYGDNECDTSSVTYGINIEQIISRRCARCHSGNNPSAGIEIYDFQTTVDYVNQNRGKFMGSILWDGTASNMPKNDSKLSNCKINLIQSWINQGMKP